MAVTASLDNYSAAAAIPHDASCPPAGLAFGEDSRRIFAQVCPPRQGHRCKAPADFRISLTWENYSQSESNFFSSCSFSLLLCFLAQSPSFVPQSSWLTEANQRSPQNGMRCLDDDTRYSALRTAAPGGGPRKRHTPPAKSARAASHSISKAKVRGLHEKKEKRTRAHVHTALAP